MALVPKETGRERLGNRELQGRVGTRLLFLCGLCQEKGMLKEDVRSRGSGELRRKPMLHGL